MELQKVSLTGDKETLLITLFGKASESQIPDSLLSDRFAADAVRWLDYDFAKLQVRRDCALRVLRHRQDVMTCPPGRSPFFKLSPGSAISATFCTIDSDAGACPLLQDGIACSL